MVMVWTEVYSIHGDETSMYTAVQEQGTRRLTGSLRMGQKLAFPTGTSVKATSKMALPFCKSLAIAGSPYVMLGFTLVLQTALG